MKNIGSGESRLESVISYVLIIGVIVSLLFILTGLVLFYLVKGNLNISLQDEAMFIHGRDFFAFIFEVATGLYTANTAIFFIIMGIAILLLTPFIRVIASVIYFAWKKDLKYMLITAFVLIGLTLSLMLH